MTRAQKLATWRKDALAQKRTAELHAQHFGAAVAVTSDGDGGLRYVGSVTPPARNLDPLPHDYR